MHRLPLYNATTSRRWVAYGASVGNTLWIQFARAYTGNIEGKENNTDGQGRDTEGQIKIPQSDHAPSFQTDKNSPPQPASPNLPVAHLQNGTNTLVSSSPVSAATRWNTESRKLMNLKRLAQLQTKLHEQNSTLPASHSDLDEKIAKQQRLVDELGELMQTHPSTPSREPGQFPLSKSSPTKRHSHPPHRPLQTHLQQLREPKQSHSSRQSRQVRDPQSRRSPSPSRHSTSLQQSQSRLQPQLQAEYSSPLEPQLQSTSGLIDNYEDHILQLIGDTHMLCEVGPAYLSMVTRSVKPNNAEFYAKVIGALLSPAIQDTALALRVLEDAKSLGLATQAMYCAVLRNASVNHPDVVRIASELQETKREELAGPTVALLQEFREHRALARLHIHSAYKGSGVHWRNLADYVVPRSTTTELDHEFRVLLYMMEAAGDFTGCRTVFQYLVENGIAFPDVNVCEYLLTSAVRTKDVKFAEWFIHVMAARVGVTEPMYSRVAHLQCQLKDFSGSIKTFAAIRGKGLNPSSDSLRTQLTALAQIGDLKGFAEESAALKEQQSNLFTLTSLKLLSVLSKRGSYPDLARLLALTENLLRPDLRYYATMLHIAAHIDDHDRFYSLLAEMRAAGIVPHASVFGELLSSMLRTGRVELDRLLDTIRAHGLVPDANLLSQLAVLHQGISDSQATPGNGVHAPFNSLTPSHDIGTGVVQNSTEHEAVISRNAPRQANMTGRDMKSEVFATLRSAEKIGIWNALNELDRRKVAGLPFYNSLLEAFSRKEDLAACREILRKMEAQGIRPNANSYNLIMAATKNPRVDEYRRSLEDMKAKGVAPNERTYNGFLSLLSKRRHWTDFDRVLDEMRSAGVAPNISTHSIILNSAALRGDLQACQQAAETLRKIGPLGPSAYTSLITAACTSGSMDQANQYLAEMIANRIHPEVHAYNKIMQVCEKRGAAKECWRLLDEMIRVGVKRNMESYATVVRTVLNQVGNDDKDMPSILWDFSKWVLNDMETQGVKPEMSVFGPIADYMAKMGDLARFKEVREWMRELNMAPDAHTLTTLAKQLSMRQEYEQARSVLKEMWGLVMKPSGVAYSALLNGLLDAELWDECENVIQDFKEVETIDVVNLCEQIVVAGKTGDTLERAKLTALLQLVNKIVL